MDASNKSFLVTGSYDKTAKLWSIDDINTYTGTTENQNGSTTKPKSNWKKLPKLTDSSHRQETLEPIWTFKGHEDVSNTLVQC